MGRNQKKQFNTNNEKIIDYSFDSSQSDFLDIWLSANCDFCISTGTGLDCIPHVYGKKTLFLNYLPLSEMTTYMKSLTVPKNLFWKNTGIKLSLDEYLNATHVRSSDYKRNNIDIQI